MTAAAEDKDEMKYRYSTLGWMWVRLDLYRTVQTWDGRRQARTQSPRVRHQATPTEPRTLVVNRRATAKTVIKQSRGVIRLLLCHKTDVRSRKSYVVFI